MRFVVYQLLRLQNTGLLLELLYRGEQSENNEEGSVQVGTTSHADYSSL